jgi:hypothetical protein
MDKTSMNPAINGFFYSIGAITAIGTVGYVINTYGLTIVSEIAWLGCKAEVKTNKLLKNYILPLYKSVFKSNNNNEPTDVCFYYKGKLINKMTISSAFGFEPDFLYDIITYTIRNYNGAAYVALHNNIEYLTGNINSSTPSFLSVLLRRGDKEEEVPSLKYGSPYVVGNILFTPQYLRLTGINIDDDEEYEIELIDNDINRQIIKYGKNKREIIKINNDGYNIESI